MKQIFVNIKIIVLPAILFLTNCQVNTPEEQAIEESTPATIQSNNDLLVGAEQTEGYLPLLKDKKLGLVINQTSMVGDVHLVDHLRELNLGIEKIFAPEHGFRGEADAGEKVTDGKDPQTGINIVSVYGSRRKPLPEDLAGLDLIIFDIQDVGARFYTYISTMHNIMEACAENGVAFMVLDRPNPNGHYVDGPVLDTAYRSFVGMHPIPVVHGMTVGEYAQMINGQGWLANGIKVNLEVIPCKNYSRYAPYSLPIKPSPNLPNDKSILLYPSICFFEGTVFSLGRGTETQFQVIGAPDYPDQSFSFTPIPRPGAKYPKHEGIACYGLDLTQIDQDAYYSKGQLRLEYLIDIYQQYPDKENFFLKSNFFNKLAGGDALMAQLKAGKSEAEIRESWEPGLSEFKNMRKQYLIYD